MSASTAPASEVSTASPLNLESVAKIVAYAGAAAYAIGLFTINQYLADLGYLDFSLAKPRAIIVGSVIIGLLFIATWPALVSFATPLKKRLPAKIAWYLVRYAVSIALTAFVFRYLYSPFALEFEVFWRSPTRDWPTALFNATLANVLCAIAFLPIRKFIIASKSSSFEYSRITLLPRIFLFIVFEILAISWIAYVIYPGLPEIFGGPSRRHVALQVPAEHRAEIGTLNIDFYNDASCTGLTKNLGLLDEGEKFVLVKGEHTAPMRIDKSLFTAVIYEPVGPFSCR